VACVYPYEQGASITGSIAEDVELPVRPASEDGSSDFSAAVPLLKRQRTSVSVLSVDVHGQVEVAGLGFDEESSAVGVPRHVLVLFQKPPLALACVCTSTVRTNFPCAVLCAWCGAFCRACTMICCPGRCRRPSGAVGPEGLPDRPADAGQ
jgi:hypothetical protein